MHQRTALIPYASRSAACCLPTGTPHTWALTELAKLSPSFKVVSQAISDLAELYTKGKSPSDFFQLALALNRAYVDLERAIESGDVMLDDKEEAEDADASGGTRVSSTPIDGCFQKLSRSASA